jgi:hypothetical protein
LLAQMMLKKLVNIPAKTAIIWFLSAIRICLSASIVIGHPSCDVPAAHPQMTYTFPALA